MTFLKSVAAKIEPDSLKLLLHRKLPFADPPRPLVNLHASSLTNQEAEFCPREFSILTATGNVGKPQHIGTALRVCFDHGKDVQWRLNNDWLADVMVGDWRCLKCDEIKKFSPRPGTNGCKIGQHLWEYVEIRYKSKLNGVSCGVDMLVKFPGGKLRLVEAKTIAKEAFASLKAPLAEHRIRTKLYLRIIEESGNPSAEYIDTSSAYVLYICKGFGFKDPELEALNIPDSYVSPFKDFIVNREDTEIEPYMEKAAEVHRFKTEGAMPKGVCPTAMCKRAAKCSVVKQCFSGSFPHGIELS